MSTNTIRVFVHPHDGENLIGRLNRIVEMKAVPRNGEYIKLEPTGDLFLVDLVAHFPFNLRDDHPGGNPDVEVWATRANELDVLRSRKPSRT